MKRHSFYCPMIAFTLGVLLNPLSLNGQSLNGQSLNDQSLNDALANDLIAADDSLGGTVSAGYMTNYVFYGVDFGGNALWGGVDYTLLSGPMSVDVGIWYINPTDGVFDDEFDVYASVSGEVAGFDAALTLSGYFYPELGEGTSYELGLALERELGFVDWKGDIIYDFVIGGWVFDTGLSKGFSITDSIELVLSGGVAYQNGYNESGSSWNHAYAMLALPLSLSENVTLEPYIGGLLALDAVEEFQGDILHGGVSLSVTF